MRNKTIFLIINSIFFFCALSTSCQLLVPKIASAQTVPLQSLRVTPVINDLQLVSGKTTTFPLTVQNLSSDPVGIHFELSGYDQIGEVPLYNQTPSLLSQWTHLSKQDLLLSPHSTQSITVTITPPSHLSSSGYYETIFLTPIVNQETIPGSPIILSRLGVLVLGTIGTLNYDDLAKKITVTDLIPSHTIITSFPKTISFTVNNHYFTHFDAKPFLTITPLFGKSQTILLPDKHVLPGSARIWQEEPQIVSPNIFYHLHLAVSIGDGKQVFTDTWFVVFPYKLFIIVIVVAVVLFFTFFRKKRIKKFLNVLLRG